MSASRPAISAIKEKSTETQIHPMARFYAGIATGTIEAALMYPFDRKKNLKQLGKQGMQDIPFWGFKGVVPYGVHKIFARTAVLGIVQPAVLNWSRETSFYSQFENEVGARPAKILAATFAGMVGGVFEVLGNPVDRWKLVCQKNNIDAIQGMHRLIAEVPATHSTTKFILGFITNQYAGWRETAKRNIVGAGTTFFGKYAVYDVMNVKDHNNPTWTQSFISSFVGAALRVAASHFPDVAKTRAQMDPNNIMSVTSRLAKIAKEEGAKQLVAGSGTKLAAAAFKFSLVLTGCEMLTKQIAGLSMFLPASAPKPNQPSQSEVMQKKAHGPR